MTRNQKIKAMREMVRDLGRKWFYNGKVAYGLYVPVVIVCEDDTCTDVEIDFDGKLCISGWDGTEGLGDYAEKYSDEDINKLYDAMQKMAA